MTHHGQSGAIDIFNQGYAVVYGLHKTGCQVALLEPDVEPAPAPEWVLEWIRKHHAERPPEIPAETGSNGGPPVRLMPPALRWWTGEETHKTADGNVDRSTTLFRIGHALARANATASVIATALQERDTALGYNKFTERKDAREYHRMAARAIAELQRNAPVVGESLKDSARYAAETSRRQQPDEEQAFTLIVTDLNTVVAKPVDWLWPRWIPLRKVTNMQGDPGAGKSTTALDIAARVSWGGPWPDGGHAPQGDVLIISAEDDLEDTIRPRLELLHANMPRIHSVGVVGRKGAHDVAFSLAEHLATLEEQIIRTKSILVILDPLTAFTGLKTDTNQAAQVRQAVMAPLGTMTARTGCAVLAITHPNKRSGEGKAIYRGSGSLDFNAAARSVIVIGRHPEDENTRVFASVKSNLSATPTSLSFHFTDDSHHAWLGTTEVTADAVLAGPPDDKKPRDEAKDFLLDFLRTDHVPATQVWDAAKENGIATNTLNRAAKELGIRRYQKSQAGKRGGGGWFWTLEAQNDADDDSETQKPTIYTP